jgi:hypothetical protein
MVNPVGTGVVVSPSGSQADSATETRKRQRQTPVSGGFHPQDGADQAGRPDSSLLQKTREAGQAVLQLLRRRTDRGEAADPAIEIPPHLERRRAWREAFGINTYHTQQMAQAEEPDVSGEALSGAHSAYRRAARRGRLDLDLAQQVSVTV